MTSTLRELILATDDLPSEDVPVPEWNCTVRVRSMTAEQRATFAMSGMTEDGEKDTDGLKTSGGRVVIMCTYDPETNESIFNDSDLPMLMRKSARAIDKLAGVAMRLSGLTGEEKIVVDEQFPE